MELIQPHGGDLKHLVVDEARAEKLKAESIDLPDLDLTNRQLWDVELLLNGAFSPLEGFMGRDDYQAVCKDMRLADGTLWPVPITLDVTREFIEDNDISDGSRVAIRAPEGMVLAILTVTDAWEPDLSWEAEHVFGTTDEAHPSVFHLNHDTKPVYLGGTLEGLELPTHHTYQDLRYTPAELRHIFEKRGWTRVVGFQTRNPMHRVHAELAKNAAKKTEANLLIHPVVGRTKPGDVDYFTRVRCYKAVLERFPEQTTMLSLLPLAMRMAGPREALWHALIRQNYGCSHFVVGRDHAGCKDKEGNGFYGPFEAQELIGEHADELEIEVVTFDEFVFSEDQQAYLPKSQAEEGAKFKMLSGTELRERLRKGQKLPEWFTFPEVTEQLRKLYPPRPQQGFTVFFTGLPSSGKSTVANILVAKLMEQGDRPVTLLDGDIVRTHLSSELGFSKEHRDLNIQRIGFVASEITKNRGVAVCAPIAPYDAVRRRVRQMIEQGGGFILVHIATPVEVCEQRDRKGLYAKARKGIIEDFTGISDPYEEPDDAEIRIDTSDMSPEEAANRVYLHLESEGYLG